MSRLMTYVLIAVSILGAPFAFAVDPPTLTSFEWLGFSGAGDSNFRLTGSFPGTTTHQDRRVFLDLDGQSRGFVQYGPPSGPAGASYQWAMSIYCLPKGQHVLRATPVSCGFFCGDAVAGAPIELTLTVDSPRILGVSVNVDQGTAHVAVSANFDWTQDASNQRGYKVSLNGGALQGPFTFTPREGTATVDLPVGCMPPGSYPYEVVAIACGRSEPEFQDRKTGTFDVMPDPVTVGLTVKKIKDANGTVRRKGTVTWDLGEGTLNRSVTVELKPWIGADGQTQQGGIVWQPQSVPQTGSGEFLFDPPGNGQQFVLVARAATCTGKATAEFSVDCDDCENATPDPVYLNDGNVRVSDNDPLPPIAGHPLGRTYNSDEQVISLFGRGWTTLFERRAIITPDAGESVISLVDEANGVVTFRGVNGNYRQTWPQARTSTGELHDGASGTYVYRAAGSTEAAVFASNGRLVELRDLRTGRAATIAYDAGGLPVSITDSWSGVAWNLTIDATRRLVTSIAVSSRPDLVWTYSYDSSGNLTSVLAPGSATWRTYEYANNRLTASRDALGNLIESHAYDSGGYGIASTGPSDEIESIQYDIATANPNEQITRVTGKNGNVTDYILSPSGGSWRTVRVVNGCGSCGARDMTLARDARGRVVRRQHADGYITTYSYAATQRLVEGGDDDDGGGETVVSDGIERLVSMQTALRPAGCDPETSATRCMQDPTALATIALVPTTASLTTSYEYGDPLWPERVTATSTPSIRVAGELRRDETQYHSVTGEVIARHSYGWTVSEAPEDRDEGGGSAPARLNRSIVTRFYGESSEDTDEGASVLAPAFAPGGSFAAPWLALPQPALMRKSIDGPRTDVADLTSFVYYPIDPSVPGDLRGRLAATMNAAGHITRFEAYDVFGNVTRTVDANGVATEMTYDALGRPKTTTIKGLAGCDAIADPLCATDFTTTRTYQPPAGPLQSEQKAGGGVTSYSYDSRGRVATISRGPSLADLRERIEYSYDSQAGQKSSERILGFENGTWIEKTRETYGYDALRQLHSVTHADATSTVYTYDREGRVATVRDENHDTPNTSYTYDPAGRVSAVSRTLATAPGSAIATHYSYDAHGNLTSVIDPNGNVTGYVFDDFGQLVSQQSPVTGTTRYEYDETGNMRRTEDANGAVTERTHDALNRVLTATSTRGAESESVTWTYDNTALGRFAIGRRSFMSDPTGSTTFSYDRRGLLREESKTIEGAAYTTSFQYDANGNRSQIRYPSGRVVQYSFDFADRPQSALLGLTPLVTSMRYLPFGPASEIVFANGTTKVVQYDARYRITRNELLAGEGEPLVSHDYGYDAAGNITSLRDLQNPSFDRVFGYDDLNRLTTANTGEALWSEGAYSYDAMGNMLSAQLGRRVRSFSYNGTTPKLLSVTEGESVQPVTYDAAGNEIGFGESGSTNTPRNLLASYGGASFGYDGRGLRTITRRSAGIASLMLSPATVDGGNASHGLVTLSSAAPAGNAVVLLTSDSALAAVPASVTIPAGQQSATFEIATQEVEEQTGVAITASYNGTIRSETLTLTRPRFDALAVSPLSVTGGNPAELTVTLSNPAPEGGVSVPLASDNAAASVPPQLVVAGGTTSASTSITTSAVSQRKTAIISAVIEGIERQASLTILPAAISVLSFAPDKLHGGSTTTGTIALTGPVPQGGVTVTLATESDGLSLPAEVTISAGEQSATFPVGVEPVERETRARVNAFLGESIFEALVTITPPELAAFSVDPGAVIGGEAATAQTSLDAPAAAEGAVVEVISSDPDIVPHPPSITVPGGSERAAAALATLPVAAATPVVLSATRNGVTRSATITVQPPAVTLASLTIEPSSLVGTNPAAGAVKLTGPAPVNGIEVELSSGDASVSVPPVVVVPPGQSSAAFEITTSLVTAARTVTMTASHATTDKTATLTVLPPAGNYVSSLSIAPSLISAGATALGRVTLAVPSDNKTDIALMSSDAAVVIVPATVTVKNKDVAVEFSIATSSVAEPSAVTITASYGGVIQRTKVIVAPANTVTLSSLVITPPRVTGGSTATALVTLTGPAPAGGAVVAIDAKRRNIVTVPATVIIPEGATNGSFLLTTGPVHGKKAKATEIVAAYNSVTATAVLTVTPLSTATISPQVAAQCASLALVPCLTRAGLEEVIATTAAETTYYLYAPELRLLAETAASTAAAPAIAYEYVWFGNEPLAQIENATGAIHWYFADHLGTPLVQTDSEARIVWQAEYEPYGSVHAFRRGESKHQPLRFPGQETATPTDLAYNIYRWYRGSWGRYTQSDPLDLMPNAFVSEAGREEPVNNTYAYAGDNPIRLTDPTGLAPCNGSCPECPSGKWAYTDESFSYGWLIWGKVSGKITYFCANANIRCFFAYKCKTVGVQAGAWGTIDTGFVGGNDCKCANALASSFVKGDPWTLGYASGQIKAPCTGGGLSFSIGASFMSTQTDCTVSKLGCAKW